LIKQFLGPLPRIVVVFDEFADLMAERERKQVVDQMPATATG
jgi:DNA segregation ATPase FtsK/SpoIIIE-like protein